MANLFTNIPAPAGNGSGAPVDLSAYGASKTITVGGSWPPTLQPTINIEINNDAAQGGSWAPVATFQGAGSTTIQVACRFMRATVSNFKSGSAPNVNVGGTDNGTLFAAPVATAGNGTGASVDVSALGEFKTVQVGGAFRGTAVIEISEDSGVSFQSVTSFNNPGLFTSVYAATHMRVRRTGVPTNNPGLPIVNVGAVDPSGGGGVTYDPPYVDLRDAPYSVVADDDDPAVALQNTTGINLAIVTFSGLNARLELPNGRIYIDQVGTLPYSIRFGPGITDVELYGQGPNETILVQQGEGDAGDWHGLEFDRCQRCGIRELGIEQGIIQYPDPIQLNHLVNVANNSADASGETNGVYGYDLSFGKAIGDQLRFFGNTTPILNCKFQRMTMLGAGSCLQDWAGTTEYDAGAWVVNDSGKNYICTTGGISAGVGGPTGTGTGIADGTCVWSYRFPRDGARSGVSIQRGYSNIEVSDFYVDGAQNSCIDAEPTGSGTMEYAYVHDFYADGRLGISQYVASFCGVSAGDRSNHNRMENGVLLGGGLSVLATDDTTIANVHVIIDSELPDNPPWTPNTGYAEGDYVLNDGGKNYLCVTAGTSAASGGPTGTGSGIVDGTCVWDYRVASVPNVLVRQINNDLKLINLNLRREDPAQAGNLLDIENPSGNRVIIQGGDYVQGTTGYPIFLSDVNRPFISGPAIEYSGALPSGKDAIYIAAINTPANDVHISGATIRTTAGKFQSAVFLATRTGQSMNNISVSDVHSAGYATYGVYMQFGAGTTFDSNPIIQGMNNGTDELWRSEDALSNLITTVHPITAGSKAALTGRCIEGNVTPEGNVIGNLGDMYSWRPTTTSAERWVKTSQAVAGTPDNVGWELIAYVP